MPDLLWGWGGAFERLWIWSRASRGGQTERPIQYLKFFLKTSSLGLGSHTKGGIDVGEEGSFVLCPAELAEETRLSQDSIQNANGGPSCTWAPNSKCFIGTVAVLSCTQELQEKLLFCYGILTFKEREGENFKLHFFVSFLNSCWQSVTGGIVNLLWCFWRDWNVFCDSRCLKECKSRLKCDAWWGYFQHKKIKFPWHTYFKVFIFYPRLR